MPSADRSDAGRRSTKRLECFRDEDPEVLGLPRGGVPVAVEVARATGTPMDVIVVRKVGLLYQGIRAGKEP
jgi:putative phosphoribosyl transferase